MRLTEAFHYLYSKDSREVIYSHIDVKKLENIKKKSIKKENTKYKKFWD